MLISPCNGLYLWQDNSNNPTFNVTQQGIYLSEVTVNNCSASDSILVNFRPTPIIDLGEDRLICEDDNLILNATTNYATYLWQDSSTDSIFELTQPGVYWVEVTVNNCSSIDNISIQTEDCQITLEIPNVFTPNGDGVNDIFVPVKSNGIYKMKTTIYNRWGNLIFETENHLIEWDGEGISNGTYFWVINYTDINSIENSLTGSVTILK